MIFRPALVALSLALLAVSTEASSLLDHSHSHPHDHFRRAKKVAKASGEVPPGCKAPGGGVEPGLPAAVATCVVNVKTEEIDNPSTGLQVGTINNWAEGHVPPVLRGLFYMEGNPFAAEVMSFGTSFWNASSNTFDMPLYAPRTWSTDLYSGQLGYNTYRGSTWQNRCETQPSGKLTCYTRKYEFKNNRILHDGDYSAVQMDDAGEFWQRASNLGPQAFSQKNGTYFYNMYKIVDANGKRTKYWDSNYLPNKNAVFQSPVSKQNFIHLGNYQEVPF